MLETVRPDLKDEVSNVRRLREHPIVRDSEARADERSMAIMLECDTIGSVRRDLDDLCPSKARLIEWGTIRLRSGIRVENARSC